MKSNQDSVGGRLKSEFYGAYAKYFVKYVHGMKTEGIRIDAITVQNDAMSTIHEAHPEKNLYFTEQGTIW
jgi:O-glycosyl hydrolase